MEIDVSSFQVSNLDYISFLIIFNSLFLKTPQLIKILKSDSVEGISLYSCYLEIFIYFNTIANARRLGLNFAAYGEMFTLSILNILIVLSFFRYDKTISYSKKVSFFCIFTLFNPYSNSSNTLGWPLLNVLVIILSFIEPCLQMHTNWENGYTKNMSGTRQIL